METGTGTSAYRVRASANILSHPDTEARVPTAPRETWDAAQGDLGRFVTDEAGDFPALAAVWDALGTQGKLLGQRGTFAWGLLPIAICEQMGMDPSRALRLSTATECYIAALDVLDDLEDEDTVDALWRTHGRATATNVATLLLFLYQRALATLAEVGHHASAVAAVQGIYARAGCRACGGQQLDLDGSFQGEDAYLAMVARKTGSLTQGIWAAAARLATDNQGVVDRYAGLGLNLGVAMQIANDVAALAAERDRSDLVRGKQNLALFFARSVVPSERRQGLEHVLRRARSADGDSHAVDRLRRLLQASGAFHYALLVADVYWERTLADLGPGPLRTLIETMRSWKPEAQAG